MPPPGTTGRQPHHGTDIERRIADPVGEGEQRLHGRDPASLRCRSQAGEGGCVALDIADGHLGQRLAAHGQERLGIPVEGRLSLETAKLSEGLFDALKKHPIPLEEAAIKALANNSAALDCYIWLAYRLHSLTAPRLVTWQALKAQHGSGFKELYHFKSKFPGVLQLALAVYPGANVEITDAGVIIKPSRPPVAPRLVAIR